MKRSARLWVRPRSIQGGRIPLNIEENGVIAQGRGEDRRQELCYRRCEKRRLS